MCGHPEVITFRHFKSSTIMTSTEYRAQMQTKPRIRAILIDLSGTLHVGDEAIPNAVEALRRLYESGEDYRIKFVTNTTKESVNYLHLRLLKCGFDHIRKEDIFSSLSAARKFLLGHQLRPMYFLEPEAMEDFRVVVGLAPSKFQFTFLNEAFKMLLLREETRLIAIHQGRYYRRPDGLALGPGAFVECLEFSSGKKATVVGKPQAEFFKQALDSCKIRAEERIEPCNALMIGDDVVDDVMGAINAGMRACLVRTGKYRPGDELKIPEDQRTCVNDFAEAVQLILESKL